MSTPFGAIINMPEPEDDMDMARRGAEPIRCVTCRGKANDCVCEWFCPCCGEPGGSPVERYYGTSRETGYHDVFEGCTLCDPDKGRFND